MPNNAYSNKADTTGLRRTPGPGMDMRRLWMCGHLSLTGKIKKMPGQQALMLMCSNCVAAKKATSAAAPPT